MRILVTGASGFIGQSLVTRLADHDLHLLSRVDADLAVPFVRWKLPSNVDAVIHGAAQIDGDDPDLMRRVNVEATEALVRWSARAGARSFLYLSTGGVYGPCATAADESQPPRPAGTYAETKLEAERIIQGYQRQMRVQIARLYFPFGPHQSGRLVPRLIEEIAAGRPISINTESGEPVLSLTYIDDLADVLVRMLAVEESTIVNVAGEAISVRELATQIGDLLGRKPCFTVRGGSPGANYIASTVRLRQLTHFEPKFGIREALRRTVRAAS